MNAAEPTLSAIQGRVRRHGTRRGRRTPAHPRTLAAGVLILTTLVIVGGMGLVPQIWYAPLPAKLSRLVET